MILDSDIIIDFLRNNKEIVKRILDLAKTEELVITSVNTFEILRGLSKFDKVKKGYEFIMNFKILDFDFESSKKAAEIFENLRAKGELIDPLDLFIASIAIVNNQPLMTRNQSHFKRIQELQLEAV